jgi:hypothetical protein
MYAEPGSFNMRYSDFKLFYIGLNPPDARLNTIQTQAEYDAVKNSGTMVMCCEDDTALKVSDDSGKIVWFPRERFLTLLGELHTFSLLFEKLYLEALDSEPLK